jgi:hypothetical protein
VLKNLKEETMARLVKSTHDLTEKVIEENVELELKRRASVIQRAYSKYKDLSVRFESLSVPDRIVEDANSKPISEGFSPEQNKQRNSVKEEMDKLEAAVGKALPDDGEPCFKDLEELVGK